MSPEEIIRAWTDEEFYLSLSDQQRALLPQNPAGMIELNDDELGDIAGGSFTFTCWSNSPCPINSSTTY
jgi:mersacidin/lichenicidin family type 2 lantibiotic